MRKLLKFAILSFAIISCLTVFAQPGSNDLTFNPNDLGNGLGDGPANDVLMSIQQPDGKILLCGVLTSYNRSQHRGIVRINPDGTLDPSFASSPGASSNIFRIALQPDGKIIAYGVGTTYNGTTVGSIFRINSNGTLDNTFNSATNLDQPAMTITLQPDGKILLTGWFTTFNGGEANRIVRLNTDGTRDNTFTGAGFNDEVNQLLPLSDGSMIAVGRFTTYNGSPAVSIVKLTSAGIIDNTFNAGNTFANYNLKKAEVLSNGKILAGGFNGQSALSSSLTRLNSDGTADASLPPALFTADVNFNSTDITILKELPNGKILVGGLFNSYNGASISNLMTINPDGSIFTSPFNNAFSGFSQPYALTGLANGKILMSGSFLNYHNVSALLMCLLNANGTIDQSFNKQHGAERGIVTIAKQADDKLIVGGYFSEYNDSTVMRIARLNPNGSLDNSFDIGTGFNETVQTVKMLPNGKIIAAGNFRKFDGQTAERIAVLNGNGSFDNSFNPGSGPNARIRIVELQSGKIIAGGDFVTFNGESKKGIVRLSMDGQLDNTFSTGTGIDGDVRSLIIQADGKILVGGDFSAYNGTTKNSILRLNSDGTLDASFTATIDGVVDVMALLSNGKVLVGGYFSDVNGDEHPNLVKLNADGTIDETFTSGITEDGNIYAIDIRQDGKIVVGGSFYNETTERMKSLHRLNADGSVDEDFDCGTGTDETIMTIVPVADNKLIIAGHFINYNNVGRNRIARIDNGDLLGINEKAEVSASVYPNPASDEVTVNFEGASALITLTDLAGREMFSISNFQTENKINLKNLPAGIYYLNLKTEKGSVTKTIVKN